MSASGHHLVGGLSSLIKRTHLKNRNYGMSSRFSISRNRHPILRLPRALRIFCSFSGQILHYGICLSGASSEAVWCLSRAAARDSADIFGHWQDSSIVSHCGQRSPLAPAIGLDVYRRTLPCRTCSASSCYPTSFWVVLTARVGSAALSSNRACSWVSKLNRGQQ